MLRQLGQLLREQREWLGDYHASADPTHIIDATFDNTSAEKVARLSKLVNDLEASRDAD